MDDPNTIQVKHLEASKLLSFTQLPPLFQDSLKKYPLFEVGQTTTKNKIPAYQLNISQKNLLSILSTLPLDQEIDFSTMQASGNIYLLVHNPKKVSLLFENIGLSDTNNFMSGENLYEISGEINHEKIILELRDVPKDTTKAIHLTQKNKALHLYISFINMMGEETKANLNINPSLS